MDWICRDCGSQVVADDLALVVHAGWTGLDGDTGSCPVCSDRQLHDRAHRRALGTVERIEESERAVAMTRALVNRWRAARTGLAEAVAAQPDAEQVELALFEHGLTDGGGDDGAFIAAARSGPRVWDAIVESWVVLGIVEAQRCAHLHGPPLPERLPLSRESARNVAEDAEIDEAQLEAAAEVIFVAATRRWAQLRRR